MATWSASLPTNDVESGDGGHISDHNAIYDCLVEIRTNVDSVESTANSSVVSDTSVTNIEFYATAAELPATGSGGVVYIVQDSGVEVWDDASSAYVVVAAPAAA